MLKIEADKKKFFTDATKLKMLRLIRENKSPQSQGQNNE